MHACAHYREDNAYVLYSNSKYILFTEKYMHTLREIQIFA